MRRELDERVRCLERRRTNYRAEIVNTIRAIGAGAPPNYTAVEQVAVDAFDGWFAQTFAPIAAAAIPVSDRIGCFRAWMIDGLLYGPATRAFDAWWSKTYPDTPQAADCHRRFSRLIRLLGEQIYYEAACDLVPIDRRHFFFDPDRWAIREAQIDFYRNWQPPCLILRILNNPTGDQRQRAIALAKKWARRDPEKRSMRISLEAKAKTPLEWFCRKRPKAASPAPTRKSGGSR
jgi:hypothetical protein